MAAGGPDRAVTRDLRAALAKWRALCGRARRPNADAGAEASTADDLEGLARRVKANMATGTPERERRAHRRARRRSTSRSRLNPRLVPAYNAAVRSYQHERAGGVHSRVASVLGYDERPQLLLGS